MSPTPIYRILAAVVFIFAALFCLAAGGVWGFFVTAYADITYESRAVIQIKPNWISRGDAVEQETLEKLAELSNKNHVGSIRSAAHIESCLIKNNLMVLDCFVDRSKQDCVKLVQEDLTVAKVPETNNMYELSIQLSNPHDAATLLNNLVGHYQLEIGRAFPELNGHYQFSKLEVARVGKQISPLLPFNIAIGACLGLGFVIISWFILNPFKVNRQFSIRHLPILCVTTVACFLIGAVVVWCYQPTLYSSHAVVRIEDDTMLTFRSPPPAIPTAAEKTIRDAAHEFAPAQIRQYGQIEKTLARNKLFDLDIFADMAKEECVEYVQDHLIVEPDFEDPLIFDLQFQSPSSEDSVKVLKALTETYTEDLKRLDSDLMARHEANDADDPSSAFGIPNQHHVTLLKSVTEAPGATKGGIGLPAILAGLGAALAGLLACFTWWFSSGSKHKIAEDKSTAQTPNLTEHSGQPKQ